MQSTHIFQDQKIGYLFPGQYLHRARQQFDTGLQLDMVQEYLLIPLDIFLEASTI